MVAIPSRPGVSVNNRIVCRIDVLLKVMPAHERVTPFVRLLYTPLSFGSGLHAPQIMLNEQILSSVMCACVTITHGHQSADGGPDVTPSLPSFVTRVWRVMLMHVSPISVLTSNQIFEKQGTPSAIFSAYEWILTPHSLKCVPDLAVYSTTRDNSSCYSREVVMQEFSKTAGFYYRGVTREHQQYLPENKEYISLFADLQECLPGAGGQKRTPIQCYADFMRSFRDEFLDDLGEFIEEVVVGTGPCGELRYPSYVEDHGWRFPGVRTILLDREFWARFVCELSWLNPFESPAHSTGDETQSQRR